MTGVSSWQRISIIGCRKSRNHEMTRTVHLEGTHGNNLGRRGESQKDSAIDISGFDVLRILRTRSMSISELRSPKSRKEESSIMGPSWRHLVKLRDQKSPRWNPRRRIESSICWDTWQSSRLSEKIPIRESISITGFEKSWILEMRRLEQIKSWNCKDKSGPSNIGGRVAEIKAIGKFPERKGHPSWNRESGNWGFHGQEV